MEVILLGKSNFPCKKCILRYISGEHNTNARKKAANVLLKLVYSKQMNNLYLCKRCYDELSFHEIQYLLEVNSDNSIDLSGSSTWPQNQTS